MRRVRVLIATAAVVGLTAGAAVFAVPQAQASSKCNRTNNTVNKLLECVTVDGVLAHEARFQAIADANGDTRASGTPGYDESVEYVADTLRTAGYNVTIQPFEFNAFVITGPATLKRVAPTPEVTYVEGVDYGVLEQTDPGTVTNAAVTAVDIQLGLGNTSTSGCEASDFAGFPAGNIALLQRGVCTFEQKSENAAAAGAVGAILFNQGNTADPRPQRHSGGDDGQHLHGGHSESRCHVRPGRGVGEHTRVADEPWTSMSCAAWRPPTT